MPGQLPPPPPPLPGEQVYVAADEYVPEVGGFGEYYDPGVEAAIPETEVIGEEAVVEKELPEWQRRSKESILSVESKIDRMIKDDRDVLSKFREKFGESLKIDYTTKKFTLQDEMEEEEEEEEEEETPEEEEPDQEEAETEAPEEAPKEEPEPPVPKEKVKEKVVEKKPEPKKISAPKRPLPPPPKSKPKVKKTSHGEKEEFKQFFGVVDKLLGKLDKSHKLDFRKSDDFDIYKKANSSTLTTGEKKEFVTVVDKLLEKLDKSHKLAFRKSDDFDIYVKVASQYTK